MLQFIDQLQKGIDGTNGFVQGIDMLTNPESGLLMIDQLLRDWNELKQACIRLIKTSNKVK